MVLECWDAEFLGTTTIFQKNNISWPQQPPTKKWLNFNMIFHDSTKEKSFSKHQNKVEFKNLDDSEVLSSDFPGPRTSAASLTSSASAASLASTASKALFHKKKSWSWWLDHPWHQNYQCGPLFVEWILKIQFFTDIWYFFCWRLLRPAVIIFLKNGCGTQKFPISAFQNHLQTKFNLHIFIRQSQFITAISIWDTLYVSEIIYSAPGNFHKWCPISLGHFWPPPYYPLKSNIYARSLSQLII